MPHSKYAAPIGGYLDIPIYKEDILILKFNLYINIWMQNIIVIIKSKC